MVWRKAAFSECAGSGILRRFRQSILSSDATNLAGARHAIPPQDLSAFPRLEGIPQGELDQTRCSDRTGNFAKRAVRSDGFHVGDRRIAKVGVVPHVEKVRREAQVLPLGELEILNQREVPVLLAGAAERVSGKVAEARGAEVAV